MTRPAGHATRAIAVVLVLATGSPARAQPAMSERAQPYLERGEAAYVAGDYARALAEFERGLAVEAHPLFHYAKAQVYRSTGDCKRAVAEYRTFLAVWPADDPAADAARSNIERCPLTAVPSSSTTTPPDASSTTTPTPVAADTGPAWYRDPLGGILAGGAAAGLAAGTTFLVLGDRDIRAANSASRLALLEELGAQGERRRTIGTVCMAAGGALAVAAVIRYVLAGRAARARAASAPTNGLPRLALTASPVDELARGDAFVARPTRGLDATSTGPGVVAAPGGVLLQWSGAF